MKPRPLALGGLLALSAPLAGAEAEPPAPPGAPARLQPGEQSLVQKAQLVERLLENAARRIGAEPSAAARDRLAAGNEHQRQGLEALKRSDFPEADAQFNAALRAAGEALRLAPDPARRAMELQMRYRNLLAGIETLTASYERHLLRAKGLPAGAPLPADAELERIRQHVARARTLAAAHRLEEAVRALGEAERALMLALPAVLGSETLDYAQRFETPAEEFAYEAERHRGYLALVPVAIAELQPSPEARQLMERYVAQSRTHFEEAQRLAGRGELAQALQELRAGTARLQGALSAGGLALPKETRTE